MTEQEEIALLRGKPIVDVDGFLVTGGVTAEFASNNLISYRGFSVRRLTIITAALLAMALPVVAHAAQRSSTSSCRSPKSYIKDLRIFTSRSGDKSLLCRRIRR